MINCDGDKTDKFLPLKFEIRQGANNRDVFEETFGFSSMRKFGKENILSTLGHAVHKSVSMKEDSTNQDGTPQNWTHLIN